MGDFRAQRLSNFWPLAAVLFCVVVGVTPAHGTEAHEGAMLREELVAPPEPAEGEYGPEIEPSGGFIGNVTRPKKTGDFNLKNLKPEDYPIEFLIPFMKVSQVFKKKVEAKDLPNVTSQMAREVISPSSQKPLPRKWTTLPSETKEQILPPTGVRSLASTEDAGHVVEGPEETTPAAVIHTVRAPAGPTKQLLKSFRASQ